MSLTGPNWRDNRKLGKSGTRFIFSRWFSFAAVTIAFCVDFHPFLPVLAKVKKPIKFRETLGHNLG